jgi:5-methylcytosine-specific restriction endonuclease McrA
MTILMENIVWSYQQNGMSSGAFTIAQMHDFFQRKLISRHTLVKNNLMKGWIPLEKSSLFSSQYAKVLHTNSSTHKSIKPLHDSETLISKTWEEIKKRFFCIDESVFIRPTEATLQTQKNYVLWRLRITFIIICIVMVDGFGIQILPSCLIMLGCYLIITTLHPIKYFLKIDSTIYSIKRQALERKEFLEREYERRKTETTLREETNRKAKENSLKEEASRRKEREHQQKIAIQKAMKNFDHCRSNYYSDNNCYFRNSTQDIKFKRSYRNHLFTLSKGRCLNCESQEELELDHAVFPKSMGGEFIMRHQTGLKQANCILLCKSCNSSKGAKDYQSYFNNEKILLIHETLRTMTHFIHSRESEHQNEFFN